MHPESPYTLELLEDYVNGLLSKEGRERVEKLIDEHEEVAVIIAGIEELKRSQGTTDGLRAMEQVEFPGQEQAQPKIRSLWPRLILVAASLAAFVVVGFFLMQNPSLDEVLAEEVSKPYSMGLTVRGDQPSEIAAAFEAGDYEKVYSMGGVLDTSEWSADTQVQLGIAALKTGRSEESVAFLDDSLDTHPLLGAVNQWYRALALTSLQDDRAVPLLQRIEDSSGFRSDAAADILDAIDRDWK